MEKNSPDVRERMKITIDPTKLIGVASAAKRKGVKRQSIYYHVNNGSLASLTIDGTVFVWADEVDALELRGPYKTKEK